MRRCASDATTRFRCGNALQMRRRVSDVTTRFRRVVASVFQMRFRRDDAFQMCFRHNDVLQTRFRRADAFQTRRHVSDAFQTRRRVSDAFQTRRRVSDARYCFNGQEPEFSIQTLKQLIWENWSRSRPASTRPQLMNHELCVFIFTAFK